MSLGPYEGAATEAGLSGTSDIAASPDGSFLVAVINPSMVLRVSSKGRLRRVAGRRAFGISGDGGPATKARLGDLRDIALTGDGGFLVLDTCRVRRVGREGIIRTVAGSGSPGDCLFTDAPGPAAGDGGPATAARLISPLDVAAMTDGGFLVAEGHRVRRVAPNGMISTVAGTGAERGFGPPEYGRPATSVRLFQPSALAPTADGGFLVKDDNGVHRVRGDGIIVPAAGRKAILSDTGALYDTLQRPRWRLLGPLPRRDALLSQTLPGYFGGQGEPATRVPFSGFEDVEATQDGGLLLSTGDQVIFSAPPRTTRLGVAVARETLPALLRRRLRYRLTRAARVTVTLSRGPRVVASTTVSGRAGLNVVRLPRRTTRGLHRASLRAVTSDGAVATNSLTVLVGPWVPKNVAASEILARYACGGECGGVEDTVERCRRFGPRRVDCVMGDLDLDTYERRACTRVVSAILRRSGYLYIRPYGCRKRRGVAYFRDRPTYTAPAQQAPPLRSSAQ